MEKGRTVRLVLTIVPPRHPSPSRFSWPCPAASPLAVPRCPTAQLSCDTIVHLWPVTVSHNRWPATQA